MLKKRSIFIIIAVSIILTCFFVCSYIYALKSQVIFLTGNIDKLNKNVEELRLSAKELDCLRLKAELNDLRKKIKRLEARSGIDSEQADGDRIGNRGFLLRDGQSTVGKR